jgi:CheY-like chemotaxis protein
MSSFLHNESVTQRLQQTPPTSQDNMPATLLLIRAGYFVIAVLSPERALEQFRTNDYPTSIDLIITDHLMPGMTGSEFVTNLRSFAPDIPVLVISGMAEAEDEYQNLRVEFRLKPLLPDLLLASVHQLVESKSSARM